jgi:hypothetical protein
MKKTLIMLITIKMLINAAMLIACREKLYLSNSKQPETLISLVSPNAMS